MLRIKKNDMVMVMTGRDKGKTGRVIRIFPEECRALVENINMVKKAKRRTQQDQKGGIISVESSIHLSNLMLLDKQSNKPTRFSANVLKDGAKVRVARKSGAVV